MPDINDYGVNLNMTDAEKKAEGLAKLFDKATNKQGRAKVRLLATPVIDEFLKWVRTEEKAGTDDATIISVTVAILGLLLGQLGMYATRSDDKEAGEDFARIIGDGVKTEVEAFYKSVRDAGGIKAVVSDIRKARENR